MTRSQLIQRFVYALVFLAAMSLFASFSLSAGLYPANSVVDKWSNDNVLLGIYLPWVYSILCLLVAVVLQFRVWQEGPAFHERIVAITMVIFFGVMLFLALFTLILSLVNSYFPSAVSSLPSLALAAGELVYAIRKWLRAEREMKTEAAAVKE